jgi:hypothetical protein
MRETRKSAGAPWRPGLRTPLAQGAVPSTPPDASAARCSRRKEPEPLDANAALTRTRGMLMPCKIPASPSLTAPCRPGPARLAADSALQLASFQSFCGAARLGPAAATLMPCGSAACLTLGPFGPPARPARGRPGRPSVGVSQSSESLSPSPSRWPCALVARTLWTQASGAAELSGPAV